jgi:hypothetical protein
MAGNSARPFCCGEERWGCLLLTRLDHEGRIFRPLRHALRLPSLAAHDRPDAPGERGSMVLLTQRRRDFGPMTCEGCGLLHGGGRASHAAIAQESDDAYPVATLGFRQRIQRQRRERERRFRSARIVWWFQLSAPLRFDPITGRARNRRRAWPRSHRRATRAGPSARKTWLRAVSAFLSNLAG